jgi:hypothetical protein
MPSTSGRQSSLTVRKLRRYLTLSKSKLIQLNKSYRQVAQPCFYAAWTLVLWRWSKNVTLRQPLLRKRFFFPCRSVRYF